MYLGAMAASAAQGAFFKPTAGTDAMHQLATFMIVFAGLFLLLSIVDRSLGRIRDTPRTPANDSEQAVLARPDNVADSGEPTVKDNRK